MIDNIKRFLPENIIKECTCGGQTYYLLSDGRVECRSCGDIKPTIRWSFLPSTNTEAESHD